MSPIKERCAFAESGPYQKEGDGFWKAYQDAADGERARLSEYSSTTMNGVLTFTGLFAATVAAFLVDSYKLLSPDTGTQTVALLAQLVTITNSTPVVQAPTDIEPFRAPRVIVLVNTLWFLGLVISLLCALLATLVQEWTRESIRAHGIPTNKTIEQYSILQLKAHMGIERYGLDRIETVIVGLMHSAVILFLIGLALFLTTIHSVPALAVLITSSVAALLYATASSIPLIDTSCPYYTPLTYVFSAMFYTSVTLIACFALYLYFMVAVACAWFTTGQLNLGVLNPQLVMTYLHNPELSVRLLRRAATYVTRRKFAEGFLRYLFHAFEPQQGRMALTAKTLDFLNARTYTYTLEDPGALRYLSRCLIDLTCPGVGWFFVELRNGKNAMSKLSCLLHNVDSALAGIGTIRFLQMLFQADVPGDNLSQDGDNEASRWLYADAILKDFPTFAGQLGKLNSDALQRKDPSVLIAVSSFRWSLILLWGRIRDVHAGSIAENCLRYLFKELDRVDGLRMHAVSSSDHGGMDDLFATTADPRLELASRNAFTLLEGAYRCDWEGDWQQPDTRYLPKNTPSMWNWRMLYVDARANGPKPAASECLRDMVLHGRLLPYVEPASNWTIPDGPGPHPVAISALRDLANIVHFQSSSHQIVGDERGIQIPSPAVAERPRSPTLRSAEEGRVYGAWPHEPLGEAFHLVEECDLPYK